jgi:hypothetical protein
MKLSTLLRHVLPLLLLVSFATAAPVIFERALPTGPNVNADAPGNLTNDALRSNIKWAPTSNYIIGDDFILPIESIIDTISVWMVAENPATTDPAQELQLSIRLFGGPNPDPITLRSTTYSFAPVTYDNGQGYWNPTRGIFQPIFELTFSNLNWTVQGNTLYNFAVEGFGTGATLSLHASNACNATDPVNDPFNCDGPGLSNSQQDAPDGAFLVFTGPPLTGPYTLQGSFYSGFDGLWDKDSDINVRITGEVIPEPSTFILIGFGLGAVAYYRRRRQA